MRIAVYPGSFDPVTNGHIDIIKRAAAMVDRLIIGVLHNSAKTPLFSAQERVNMLKEVCGEIPNIEIRYFEGLLVDFVVECNATIVVRGLRAVTDFEYELQWAQSNRIVCPQWILFSCDQCPVFLFEFQCCPGVCLPKRRHFRLCSTLCGGEIKRKVQLCR